MGGPVGFLPRIVEGGSESLDVNHPWAGGSDEGVRLARVLDGLGVIQQFVLPDERMTRAQ